MIYKNITILRDYLRERVNIVRKKVAIMRYKVAIHRNPYKIKKYIFFRLSESQNYDIPSNFWEKAEIISHTVMVYRNKRD